MGEKQFRRNTSLSKPRKQGHKEQQEQKQQTKQERSSHTPATPTTPATPFSPISPLSPISPTTVIAENLRVLNLLSSNQAFGKIDLHKTTVSGMN